MKILVSACLLGENCKYNGKNNYSERVAKYLEGHEVIPVCPEVLGGLPTPRDPSEIVSGGEMRNAVSQNRNQSLRMPASLNSSMMRYSTEVSCMILSPFFRVHASLFNTRSRTDKYPS